MMAMHKLREIRRKIMFGCGSQYFYGMCTLDWRFRSMSSSCKGLLSWPVGFDLLLVHPPN